ncbi:MULTISPECIES: hypothetical protein [unclassified Rhizobium]|uniref:hypothetical protein n=1 Tax=unclassified Rhizobium TaxID=2613769 RepID=UPI00177C9957|nr:MULTISPECIES: hypothetical protein [unclassified Rhizobium]MBD8688848.1 hypothetical protein [Rhizobium sp. CFBP 13644]MBD8694181.1 hypothetical protein [Rhizobium sp. CFBP 13717]
MTETSANFYPISILLLTAMLAVFAMKYAAAAYRSRLEIKRVTNADAAIAGLQTEVTELKARLEAIEKILREVE